jgi:hypothetical protein
MKSLEQPPTVLQEFLMKRPDLATLACVNAACQLFGHTGAHNLVIRKVYGHDRMRLLRCRTCGEEFSERRGTALFHTKLPEEQAASIINVETGDLPACPDELRACSTASVCD